MASRDFQSLRALLPDILAKVARESGRARHLMPLWREAVGEPIAQAARPVSLEGGVLSVAVTTPEWARELERQGAQLVRRLSQRLGPGVVHSLRVNVAPADAGPREGKPS